MAVEESARMQPTATPICQLLPMAMVMPAIAATESITCNPPSPKSLCRSCHSFCGASSKPTRNSIITTPNSATCWMDSVSLPAKPKTGPMAIPAIK